MQLTYPFTCSFFLDETGADQRNAVRQFGYSLPLLKETPLVRGNRMSAIAIISTHGLLDVQIRSGTTDGGTTDGDVFYKFAEKCLLPQLQPFNGVNEHSVVVMDNCSIHHISEIVKNMVEDVGALCIFCLPYPPDFNPIEI